MKLRVEHALAIFLIFSATISTINSVPFTSVRGGLPSSGSIYYGLFFDGFESGDFVKWSGTIVASGCSVNVVDSVRRFGNYSASFYWDSDGTNDNSYVYKDVSQLRIHTRIYFQLDALPPSDGKSVTLLSHVKVGGTVPLAAVAVENVSGKMKFRISYVKEGVSYNVWILPSKTIQANRWYFIELYTKVDGSSGEVGLWLDGNEEAFFPVWNNTSSGVIIDRVCIGQIGGWFGGQYESVVYVDSVIFDDKYIGLVDFPSSDIDKLIQEYQLPLHTEGDQIIDALGNVLYLRGVAKMGFEYANPAEGSREVLPEFYDYDARFIASWGANTVRVPFNKYWYDTDPQYRYAVRLLVDTLARYGIVTIMDLHWYRRPDGSMGQLPDHGLTEAEAWAIAQECYTTMENVAFDYLDQPYMIGVELNEFWPLDIRSQNWLWVLEMGNELARRVHDINPNLLGFIDIMFNAIVSDQAWNDGVELVNQTNLVLAPHLYVDDTYRPWGHGKRGPDDGWDYPQAYQDGLIEEGKAKMYTYLDYYYASVHDMYNRSVDFTEFSTGGYSGYVQACYDLMQYFKNQGWSFSYWAYYGTDVITLQLLLGDWETLTPQGEAFVQELTH